MLLVGAPSSQMTSLVPLPFLYPRHRRGLQCCKYCINYDLNNIDDDDPPPPPPGHDDSQVVDVPLIENRQCEQWHSRRGITVRIYNDGSGDKIFSKTNERQISRSDSTQKCFVLVTRPAERFYHLLRKKNGNS